MNKEEKEAFRFMSCMVFEEEINKNLNILLNLIDKQQKEIEELKKSLNFKNYKNTQEMIEEIGKTNIFI